MTRHGLAGGALLVALVVALAGCGGGGVTPDPVEPTTTPPPDDRIVLTQDGLGDLDLGPRDSLSLSLTDVESWLGDTLSPKPQTGDCSLATNEDFGLAIVTDEYNGVLGFVIDHPDVVTPEGIRVGSSTEELEAAYGEAVGVVEGSLSRTGGPLALVDDTDAPGASPDVTSRHLAFDTDTDGTVTRLKSGYWPWVGYRDYCEPVSESPQDTGWPLTES